MSSGFSGTGTSGVISTLFGQQNDPSGHGSIPVMRSFEWSSTVAGVRVLVQVQVLHCL